MTPRSSTKSSSAALARIAAVAVVASACNLITAIGELEIVPPVADGGGADGSGDTGGGAADGSEAAAEVDGAGTDATGSADASSDVVTDADVVPDAAKDGPDTGPLCPTLTPPLRSDFDDNQLGPEWTIATNVAGSGVAATGVTVALANGGAIVSKRTFNPTTGAVRIFGQFSPSQQAQIDGQTLAIYSRSSGVFSGNRPVGIACVLDGKIPRVRFDGYSGAPPSVDGLPMLNMVQTVEFDVFDDGTNVRCRFQVPWGGDVVQIQSSSAWLPPENHVVIQSRETGGYANRVEHVTVEHGIAAEPTNHFEFEGYYTAMSGNLIASVALSTANAVGSGPTTTNRQDSDRFYGGAAFLPGGNADAGQQPGYDFDHYAPVRVGQLGTGPFSFALRAWVGTLPASTQYVIGNGRLDLRLHPTGSFEAKLDDGVSQVTLKSADGILSAAAWHQIVVVRSGTAADLWIDQTKVASGSSAGVVNVSNGQHTYAAITPGILAPNVFSGRIDSVRTYSRALTPCEIAAFSYPR